MKADDSRQTKILENSEVKQLSKALRQFMKDGFPVLEEFNVEVEDIIRFQAVSKNCENVRKERNLSIKETASSLKVPQYRIKAIENGRIKEIKIQILEKYIEFLDLASWFSEWKEANEAMRSKLCRQK